MNAATLEEFVDPVPVCAVTANLEAVLGVFGWANSERIMVIGDQSTPVGIVHFHRLAPYLIPDPASKVVPETAIQHQTLQELHYRFLQVNLLLIEPVVPVSIHLSLLQLRTHLQSIPHKHWAVVDASGNCVGLLNQLRVWQALATESATYSTKNQPDSGSSEFLATHETKDVPSSLFTPLIQLLERLPLPVMLQTGAGQIVTQNLAWRQQIGELQDPSVVRQEAAVVLEAMSALTPRSSENAIYSGQATPTAAECYASLSSALPLNRGKHPPPPELVQPGSSSDTMLEELQLEEQPASGNSSLDPATTSGICRLGVNSNTCICVCPMKNGQERIWQFVKVPLGSVFTGLTSFPSSLQSNQLDQSVATAKFQLAALGRAEGAWSSLPASSPTAETLWVVLAQDTTEQQQVAKELAAKNADLVQLNRLKDEFLACITHELKTPLTAILGLSSLLKDQLLGALNERQTRYAQLIYQGGRHLVLIVNDILDLTRIETGQLELTPEPVSVNTVCQRAFEQAQQLHHLGHESHASSQALIPDRSTHFTLEIQPGLKTIVADEMRLRQMLSNLLSNALKFTDVEGEIGLKVELWEGWVAFTVWDTGIGIPADKQHLIFQKFQQLENPLTRRFEGTGLGLVLTQRLARMHGGDVTFTSVEGQGSQFTLLLPPSPPKVRGTGNRNDGVQGSVAISGKQLVLVVEAVPRFLDDLTNQLTGLGYRVAIARSGTEALEKIRRLQPAVVFLNPLLPLLSGWDVLTLLKSDQETCHIPVIVTATRVERKQAYSNGAEGFLSLPVQSESLQRSLDHLVNQLTSTESSSASHPLTVLHLHPVSPATWSDEQHQSCITDLNSLLHPHHCRVVQVDDLDQADLLARVWKPDLILLDGVIPEPLTYLKHLSQCSFLASLPLVTLTPEMTQAANQVSGLTVFPCLAPLIPGSHQSDAPALWQVMQIAAGTNWTSHILVADLTTLQASLEGSATNDTSSEGYRSPQLSKGVLKGNDLHKLAEWLQAMAQYIQTAGFRSSVARSWSDVHHHLEHHSVDLLLLCIRQVDMNDACIQALQTLRKLDAKPPILVWDCQSWQDTSEHEMGYEVLETIATQMLPPSLSMQELLDQIHQTLVAK